MQLRFKHARALTGDIPPNLRTTDEPACLLINDGEIVEATSY